MEKRIKELVRILRKYCSKHEKDCGGCPVKKKCDEYIKLSTEIK